MKKLFYFLFFSITIYSQQNYEVVLNNNLNETTLEEYNYLSKGYKIQIESGLDMKSGYTLKDLKGYFVDKIDVYSNGTHQYRRESEFKLLFRANEKKPIAILMILTVYDKNKLINTNYYCIPSYNSNLWNNLQQDIYNTFIKKFDRSTQLNRVDLYQHFFNNLKMISFVLTSNNL